jgi:hypothetical protein
MIFCSVSCNCPKKFMSVFCILLKHIYLNSDEIVTMWYYSKKWRKFCFNRNKKILTYKSRSIYIILQNFSKFAFDRAIAQSVGHRLPTAAARVRAKFRSCGICGGQSGTGAGFLRVLRFPLPLCIPPIAPQSPSANIWVWYSGPIVAAVPSGLSLTTMRKQNALEIFLVMCIL